MAIIMAPVGWVRGGRDRSGDDDWGAVRAAIELDAARFGAEALIGMDAFSHAEILFQFDRLAESAAATGARHPRGNPAWPRVGIFAQRGSRRPNRIGATVCEILGVTGACLHVRGLDAIDGTPVLDIKPWFSGFAPRGTVREPAWAREIMARYW